jgi:tetratricopeptide (TPR) repeat protein
VFPPKVISPFRKISGKDIIGRSQDLHNIRKLFSDGAGTVLLHAPDGIGKTTLAAVYATDFYEEYQFIAWLTVGNSLEDAILTNPDFLLNLGVSGSTNHKTVSCCLEILFSARGEKPGLLILDDADPNITAYHEHLTLSTDWHVLATSKDHIQGYSEYEPGPLATEEAVLLFQKSCTKYDAQQVSVLVNELCYNTLLIEFLSKSKCTKTHSFDETLAALRIGRPDDISSPLFDQNGNDNHTRFVRGILDLCRPDEKQSWLLRNFSVLPPLWFEGQSLYELFSIDSLTWKKEFPLVLEDLAQQGFLQKDTEAGKFQMHSLVSDAVRKVRPFTPAGIQVLTEHIDAQLKNYDTSDDPGLKFRFAMYAESILRIFRPVDSPGISSLQKSLAVFYKDTGESENARGLLEEALEADRMHFGDNHPGISAHQAVLGHVYRDLGEFDEARSLYESALQSDIEQWGYDHPRIAKHHAELAGVYQDLGEFEKARDLLENALKKDIEIYPAGHPYISQTQSNLATIYKNLGEFEKARDLLESALKSGLDNFGEKHPSVSVIRSNLATIYRHLGENGKARDLLEAALESAIELYGEKHPDIAVSRSILANVYAALGEFAKAEELWEKTLKSNLENFGEGHPNVALCRVNLAGNCAEQGNYEKARSLLEEALKSDLINFGAKHPYVALCQSNLANVYHNLGDLDIARELFEKTLAIHEEIYESDHPFITEARSNLANVHADLGNWDKACDLLDLNINSEISKYGECHPNVAILKSNLASLYADVGDVERAHVLWTSAYEILVATTGAEHPHAKAVQSFLDGISLPRS